MAFMEIITMEATAPSTTMTQTAMFSTDSSQIRQFDGRLLALWGMFQTTLGFAQWVSPQMHENATAIKFPTVLADQTLLVGPEFTQPLKANDKIGMYASGSAVAGDFESVCGLIGYDQGTPNGRFTDWQTVRSRGMHLTSAYATLTAATTAIYGGGTLVSAFTHSLKNGVDYALLGMTTTVLQGALCIAGPCTGNYRIGLPGNLTRKDYFNRSGFVDLSIADGKKWIPVLNGGELTSTTVSTVNDENAASPIVTLYLVQLPNGAVPANS